MLRDRVIYPDRHVGKPPETALATMPSDVGVTIAKPAVERPSLHPADMPLRHVEIRDVAERRRVTMIEILLPANKHDEGTHDRTSREHYKARR